MSKEYYLKMAEDIISYTPEEMRIHVSKLLFVLRYFEIMNKNLEPWMQDASYMILQTHKFNKELIYDDTNENIIIKRYPYDDYAKRISHICALILQKHKTRVKLYRYHRRRKA